MATRTSAWWPLAVALVGVLVNLNSLANGFALDDVAIVAQNPSIESLGRIHVPFEFETAGSQIIFYEPGVDYLEAEKARERSVFAFKEFTPKLAEAS